jgi:transposase-like protein
MQARYRKDYPGEFVIIESKWAGGKKQERREWIENPIVNQHLSGRAAVIGSSDSKDSFNYKILENHRGGLLGSLTLQTYGTAAITNEMRLDFAVDTNLDNLLPLIENKYTENNIVYTTSRNCVKRPGEFYLIPYSPLLCSTVLPIYLAAFDGHKEIFMIGYDKETDAGQNNWIFQVTKIIKAYSGTKFTLVGNELNMPGEWLSCTNTRCFNFRDFVTYCDV